MIANITCLTHSTGIKEPYYSEFTWSKSLVLAFGGLTLRGWNKTPEKTSTRIAFIM